MNHGSTLRGSDGAKALRGWFGLGLGVVAFLVFTYVLLPMGQRLPLVNPVMQVVAEADIKVGQYWYTQSEETAQGVRHVRCALRREDRKD